MPATWPSAIRTHAAVLVAVVLGAAGPARAQQPFPYRISSGRETVLLAAGGAAFTAGLLVTAELDVLTPEDVAAANPQDVNAFDRPATTRWSPDASALSDGTLVVTVGAPLVFLALARERSARSTIALMFGETILLTNGIGQLLKGGARRTRPYVYNDDGVVPLERKTTKSARQSLPSGHAANAFASAVFLSVVHATLWPDSPARPWIWAGSLTAAGTVAYLRYASGKHFPTDILAGAALGGAIGWAVPQLHRSEGVRLSIVPGRDETLVGLSLRF
jgi:membrane-associated phospholipid phosphatase